MRSIDIAASTPRLDVDNRFSIRVYYRIADNILKQADIFRKEKNIVDQYIMLLRFSSLVTETIPRHREYKASNQRQKEYLKRKLLIALSESEALKPAVQQRLDEWNGKHTRQVNGWGHGDRTNSIEWPPSKNQIKTDHYVTTAVRPAAREYASQGSRTQQLSHVRPEYGKFHRMSLNFATPKVETLSKHSILGPNGLSGQWQPPKSDKGVKYPINIDFTPVEIPSLQQPVETRLTTKTYIGSAEPEKPSFELTTTPNDEVEICRAEEPSMISFETAETPASTNLIRQPSPPPVLADVQDLITEVSPAVNEMDCQLEDSLSDSFNRTEPLQLHISTTMMETFMKLAKSNTNKNLETCGVLAGSLKSRKFYVTALIIPKQESTSDSCQTTNEEEIFEVQDKQSLFPLGWIHTHPTQSCFMSSIDVHTHYSYQIMLPEAVAIVMAPRDSTRKHGIFRLTNPGGISVIRNCQQRGFHPHDPPPDGGPIYESCTDVYMNPNLKFDVIDLR